MESERWPKLIASVWTKVADIFTLFPVDLDRRHPLVSVVVIALMAVLAGPGGPTAIAQWAAEIEFL